MDNKRRNRLIAANIKKLIEENGITQKKLAKDIGISPSTISDYMNLRSNPSHGVIQKIADYFSVAKSDIDTTYKIDSEAQEVWARHRELTSGKKSYTDEEMVLQNLMLASEQLEIQRQKNVLDFAVHELEQQRNAEKEKIVSMPKKREVGDFAAHSDDPNKKVTEEEKERIHDFLDYLDEKHDKNK